MSYVIALNSTYGSEKIIVNIASQNLKNPIFELNICSSKQKIIFVIAL